MTTTEKTMSIIEKIREAGKTVAPDAKSTPEAIQKFGKFCVDTFQEEKAAQRRNIDLDAALYSNPNVRIRHVDPDNLPENRKMKPNEGKPGIIDKLDHVYGAQSGWAFVGATLASSFCGIAVMTPQIMEKIAQGHEKVAEGMQSLEPKLFAATAAAAIVGGMVGWIKGKDLQALGEAVHNTPGKIRDKLSKQGKTEEWTPTM